MEKLIIGRNEYISLPDLNFFNIDAKIDTGAFSSSIHCDEIYLNDDRTKVHFRLLDDSHVEYHDKEIVMDVYEIKYVKSSNGTKEERVFIKTALALYGQVFDTEISLTDRASMAYPMLIGRKMLEGHFVVDVSLSHESTREKKEN